MPQTNPTFILAGAPAAHDFADALGDIAFGSLPTGSLFAALPEPSPESSFSASWERDDVLDTEIHQYNHETRIKLEPKSNFELAPSPETVACEAAVADIDRARAAAAASAVATFKSVQYNGCNDDDGDDEDDDDVDDEADDDEVDEGRFKITSVTSKKPKKALTTSSKQSSLAQAGRPRRVGRPSRATLAAERAAGTAAAAAAAAAVAAAAAAAAANSSNDSNDDDDDDDDDLLSDDDLSSDEGPKKKGSAGGAGASKKRKASSLRETQLSKSEQELAATLELTRDELLNMTSEALEVYAQRLASARPLTADEQKKFKRQRRLIKNRESAQLSRMRKKAYVDELEKQIADLNEEKERYRRRCELQSRELEQSKQQMVYMRSMLAQHGAALPPLVDDQLSSLAVAPLAHDDRRRAQSDRSRRPQF